MSLLKRAFQRRSTLVPNSGSPTFRGGRDPGPNDVFIAVMGVTGSGKSSFISKCSGQPVKIGHSLEACTSTVGVYAYELAPDCTVYLIDTPGFDDTNKNDTEVLREIAMWLGASYRDGILLSGIIYLHRVTDVRMQGSAIRNLLMFKQLCGRDALKKVILVTTMWDRVLSEEGNNREKELKETPDFWGKMLINGSSCHRYHNTEASARDIVHRLANHNAQVTLDLQRQLVVEQRTLDQTSAGRELQGELLKEKTKWAKERRQIEEQMKEAIKQRDREAEKIMREERDKYTRMIKKVENDTGTLRYNMENLLAERDQRVARMEKQIQKQEAAHEDELRRLNDRQLRLEREKVELEKKREQEDQARRQREKQSPQQPTRQVQNRKPTNTSFCPPYSVAMRGNQYVCSSKKQLQRNVTYPSNRAGSAWLEFVTLGTDGTWIARYSNDSWYKSLDIAPEYPHLSAKIGSHGLNNLELCALGPGQTYFARWRDSTTSWWASEDARNALSKADNNANNTKVFAMAFGYGGSYIISYGSASKTFQDDLGYIPKLNGWYPTLSRLINENKSMTILAIALNPHNTTDYIIIWKLNDNRHRMNWLSSHNNGLESIRSWWDKS